MSAEESHSWVATGGPAFRAFVNSQPGSTAASSRAVFTERVSGLFRRIPQPSPTLVGTQSRQLVVGSVQSGKTGTFIGATVLAAENKFEISIILAGRLTTLMYQTLSRICAALVPDATVGLDGNELVRNAKSTIFRDGTSRVAVVPKNIRGTADFRAAIASEIAVVSNSIAAGETAHIVLVCLKTPSRLAALKAILADAALRGGLRFPGLFIDDECDEASPNTHGASNVGSDSSSERVSAVSQGIQSVLATYRGLQCLFFTATPQANLLLDISDSLSPDYVYVLEDSPGYVGPDVLLALESQFLEPAIAEQELPGDAEVLPYPPESLREAVAFFLWTAMLLPRSGVCDFVTMLVHPSRLKRGHLIYMGFCERIINTLTTEALVIGNLSTSSIESLKAAYQLLPEEGQTQGRNALGQILGGALPAELRAVLEALQVQVLNSDAQLKTVNWADNVPRILVGGDILGRGFTVENLTTTYMPRGKAQALDTSLQRCRFFGYRQPYVAWLRSWMDDELKAALVDTAYSERILKNELRRADDEDMTLKSFRRTFLLHPGMRATRSNVISMPYHVTRNRGNWAFLQRRILDPSGRPSDRRFAYETIEEMVQGYLPYAHDAFGWSDAVVRAGQHYVVDIALSDAVQLLESWPVSPYEVSRLNACALQIALHLEESEESRAKLILISPGKPRWRSPARRFDGDISEATFTLHQGGQKARRDIGDDANIFEENAISIQIHEVKPRWTQHDADVIPEVVSRFHRDSIYGLAVRLPTTFDVGIGTP